MIKYLTSYGSIFDEAFSLVMELEGIVLTNDPDDPGGMTICGISRVHNPNWKWWSEIDLAITNKKLKYNTNVPKVFVSTYVADFYYENYWLKYSCNELSKDLATEIFEQAINPGPMVMTRNLQECLNALNYSTKLKDKEVVDLVVDGKWGKNTKTRLLEYAKKNNSFLVKAMNAKQASYYLSLVTNNVAMRKYIKGWLNRV